MQRLLLVWLVCVSLMFVGCFGSGGGQGKHGGGAGGRGANQGPVITGSPPPSAFVGETYAFQPFVLDPEGDTLSFTITHQPDWAVFDTTTGRLSGTPRAGDVGHYSKITISVSDGLASASLPAFDVRVTQTGDLSATLSWLPPTENGDGSPLTDLAGYRIYVGLAANALARVIVLNNPGLTRYVVENLSHGTWYFAMTAVNRVGKVSVRSATVSKVVG